MATPELTYGGFPLAGRVHERVISFMERYQDTEDLRDIAPSIARIGSRADGLAWPNYPAPPKLRPNQLYWPTGAARWSLGYFFTDDENKKKITEAAHSTNNTALELRIVQNKTFTTNLFLLTPRQVSCVEDGEHLWLLPLVDERYFWQFRDIGDFTVNTSSTWAAMFTQFNSRIGVSIDADTAASGYLIPDPEELTRRFDNAGVLLDAVAHSIGQRIVRWPDGTIKSMNFTTSTTQLTTNLESKTPWEQSAGGELDFGPVPASVNVVCRRFVDHVTIPDKVKIFNQTASSHLPDAATTSGTVKTIHTTAYANMTSVGTGDPDNNADLDSLAEEIASDFYDSTLKSYDRTFSGIKLWDTSGYDDHVLYQFGGLNSNHESRTRVQSMPVNFGVEHQLSQDSTLRPLASHQFGDLDEELNGTNPATFSIWESDDTEDRTETGHTEGANNIEVFKFADQVVPPGVKSHAFFDFESEKWYVHPRNSTFSGTVQVGTFGAGSSAWSNASADGIGATNHPVTGGWDAVAVKKDDAGDPINVRLPRIGGQALDIRAVPAPNLRAGDIINFSYDESGNAVITSGYLDAPINAIMMWDKAAVTTGTGIPFGWQTYSSMDGRLPVGVSSGQTSEPDIDTPGTTEVGDDPSTAGNFQHDHPNPTHSVDTHTINNHAIDDHSSHEHEVVIPAHDEHHHHLNLNDTTDSVSGVNITTDTNTSGVIDSGTDGSDVLDHPATQSGIENATLSHNTLSHSGSLGHASDPHDIAAINHYPPMWTVFFIIRIHE